MNIYAIHGFLGRPADWSILQFPHQAVDLHEFPVSSLQEWAKAFNATTKGGGILIGYSMGGRLALHALQNGPWKAAILIATRWNIPNKQERLLKDEAWAHRFEHDAWHEVMQDWNNQEVFKGSVAPPREEQHYNRKWLSSALRKWSLGHQEVGLPKVPTLWIYGENDQPHSVPGKHVCIPHAGHRVLWDQPSCVRREILNFINKEII